MAETRPAAVVGDDQANATKHRAGSGGGVMSDRVDDVLCYWRRRRRGGNVLFLKYAIYGGKVAPVQVFSGSSRQGRGFSWWYRMTH
jgi:hypothetical protein